MNNKELPYIHATIALVCVSQETEKVTLGQKTLVSVPHHMLTLVEQVDDKEKSTMSLFFFFGTMSLKGHLSMQCAAMLPLEEGSFCPKT